MKTKKKIWLILTAVVIVVSIVGYLYVSCRNANTNISVTIENSDQIDKTAQTVVAIRDIGQWEFLSVACEEMVDTTRRGIFSNDHLARIYYGTLRIGVDLKKLSDDAITVSADGDSISIVLPPVTLLDQRFIDEANTRAFHESGSWKAADREALYRRAKEQMKRRALTRQNLQNAEKNGREQMEKLLSAMGFKYVTVSFQQR